MDVNEASLPVVLSLLEQFYDMRCSFHELAGVLGTKLWRVETDARPAFGLVAG